ncbi:signal peptide-containing protein [Acetobacter orientalis]|uniref:Signal peptide-containing protein n=1 Tax=Acetobacter orientalis TaxID=146474 RepID=A0A2Z5ZE38_9PROT|nr:signal peptide-containing protein [Acetobacter orientalis]
MSSSLRKILTTSCLLSSVFLALPASSYAKSEQATQNAQKLGTILEKAPLPAALSLPHAGPAYRITYLSTNGITQNGLVPVTAEVILPAGKAPKGGWPIVAWAHGTVGINNKCAPSLSPTLSVTVFT